MVLNNDSILAHPVQCYTSPVLDTDKTSPQVTVSSPVHNTATCDETTSQRFLLSLRTDDERPTVSHLARIQSPQRELPIWCASSDRSICRSIDLATQFHNDLNKYYLARMFERFRLSYHSGLSRQFQSNIPANTSKVRIVNMQS